VAEPLYVILSPDGHSLCRVYARPAPPEDRVPPLVAALATLLGHQIPQQFLWTYILRYAGSADLGHPMWQRSLQTVADRERAVTALRSPDADDALKPLLGRLCAAAVGRRIALLPRTALLASTDAHPAVFTVIPDRPSWLPPVYVTITSSLCHAVFPALPPSSPPWPPDPVEAWRAPHYMCERCLTVGHHATSVCPAPAAGVSLELGRLIRQHHSRWVCWLYAQMEPQ